MTRRAELAVLVGAAAVVGFGTAFVNLSRAEPVNAEFLITGDELEIVED